MTPLDLPALRAALAAGTARPWELDDHDGRASIETPDGFAIAYPAEFASMHTVRARGRDNSLPDAALIVAAVNSLEGLLDRVEQLEAGLADALDCYDEKPGGPEWGGCLCPSYRHTDDCLHDRTARLRSFLSPVTPPR